MWKVNLKSTWHERGTKKKSESPTGIEPMTSRTPGGHSIIRFFFQIALYSLVKHTESLTLHLFLTHDVKLQVNIHVFHKHIVFIVLLISTKGFKKGLFFHTIDYRAVLKLECWKLLESRSDSDWMTFTGQSWVFNRAAIDRAWFLLCIHFFLWVSRLMSPLGQTSSHAMFESILLWKGYECSGLYLVVNCEISVS